MLLSRDERCRLRLEKKHRQKNSLGEVGQVLRDFGDQSERARRAVVGILLHEVEKWRRHDGRAEEAQEQRGADQPLADVRPTPATALLPPRRKDFFQFSWKNTVANPKQNIKMAPLRVTCNLRYN